MDIIINRYYEDNLYPTLDRLYKILKNDDVKVSKAEVKKFLDNQEEQQLTKETKLKKKDYGHITALYENQIWQLDIFILLKYKNSNKHYSYILSAVDVFTRKAYCIKMKSKDIDDVTDALKSMFKAGGIPQCIISDSDSSFIGGEFQNIMKKYEIVHDVVPIGDHMSLGIIDRFARTIKTLLTKVFLKHKNSNWIDYLDKLVANYNNSPHSSLSNIAPNEVKNNIPLILELNKRKSLKNDNISDLKEGDKVRIIDRTFFQKGTEAKYSDKVFTVSKVNGKRIKLDNGVVKKRENLLLVPPDSVSNEPSVIKKVNKENRIDRRKKQAGIADSNVISERETRERKKPSRFRD